MTYLLDANVFIQAKNIHYGLDFCPAFWGWLVTEIRGSRCTASKKLGTKSTRDLMSCLSPGMDRVGGQLV